jgi:calcium-dependent protein kinase
MYLERHKIHHRDLKPENFLLNKKDDLSFIKLADFGLSHVIGSSDSSRTNFTTPSYMAPETLSKKDCFKSDVWSLGVAFYQMLSGTLPFKGASTEEIIYNVMNQELDFGIPQFARVSFEAKDLVCRMLRRNVND